MAAINKVSSTIQEFRSDVMSRGGPQIASMYEVTLNHVSQQPLVCYPLSVVIPGRQFIFFEHDMWGPIRRIPYKRGYTQCHMSFIVYQDWQERTYLERWMNTIIKNTQTAANGLTVGRLNPSDKGSVLTPSETQTENTVKNNIDSSPISKDAYFGIYEDAINYTSGYGSVQIKFVNSQDKDNLNRAIVLNEAFPAAISQMSMASDGTGYPTFNVTFQFNNYIYL